VAEVNFYRRQLLNLRLPSNHMNKPKLRCKKYIYMLFLLRLRERLQSIVMCLSVQRISTEPHARSLPILCLHISGMAEAIVFKFYSHWAISISLRIDKQHPHWWLGSREPCLNFGGPIRICPHPPFLPSHR